ncbi:hypothetical protein GBA52_004839 [Prunus armeniaca]|nr:hypothetical protein GBA52_004839 [Prunus armeniaca]
MSKLGCTDTPLSRSVGHSDSDTSRILREHSCSTVNAVSMVKTLYEHGSTHTHS